jgi:thioredoxin 1
MTTVQGSGLAERRTPLLVFFRSEESGPARRMDSLIAHIARKERGRLRVTVVDIGERPDLAARFRVSTVPTLALVQGRRVIGRLEGRVSAPMIARLIEPHLSPTSTDLEAIPAVG